MNATTLACLILVVLLLLREALGAWIFLRNPKIRARARKNLLLLWEGLK